MVDEHDMYRLRTTPLAHFLVFDDPYLIIRTIINPINVKCNGTVMIMTGILVLNGRANSTFQSSQSPSQTQVSAAPQAWAVDVGHTAPVLQTCFPVFPNQLFFCFSVTVCRSRTEQTGSDLPVSAVLERIHFF